MEHVPVRHKPGAEAWAGDQANKDCASGSYHCFPPFWPFSGYLSHGAQNCIIVHPEFVPNMLFVAQIQIFQVTLNFV